MAEEQEIRTQVITNKGLVLLGDSPLSGANQTYWLGYFGFAYVPDEAKTGLDELTPTIPRLTTNGDMIYNIWQGSMTPNGNMTDVGGSNASDLYSQCQYTNNITANFRYSVDKATGKNTLTVYRRGDDGKLDQWGNAFEGVSVEADDTIAQAHQSLPIPAPLFYKGSGTRDDYIKVTGDPRNYDAKTDLWEACTSTSTWNPVPANVCGSTPDTINAETYISNFNKYHAPAISNGYMVGQEPSCRNMATVTKYFPVAHYSVESTEGSKVAALKLTLEIDMDNIASKVANRTNYAVDSKNSKELDAVRNLKPIGFKFNRVGIYAVPMAVHQYSYEEQTSECRNARDIQYQVIGDEEPILFAVIDLDQVITVEEGSAIGSWKQSFVINFGMAGDNSVIERNPVVYYNLYEDDSIVWYKNQLIANASAAEAVTNLGIEMNYLKNQIENIRSGESCGLGFSGDEYALVGHTHNYMKNIVDSTNVNNGAVRGIYTAPEGHTYTVYRTNGQPYDELPEVMFELKSYKVGDNSFVLGKNNICAGKYSINQSVNGMMDSSVTSILLMGGRETSNPDIGDHLAVENTNNSILNLNSNSEISYMSGSLWIAGDTGTYAASVQHSMGAGRNDTLPYELDIQQVGSHPAIYVHESLLLGRNNVCAGLTDSIIAGSGSYGSKQLVSALDVLSDMNPDQLNYDSYSNDIFESTNKEIYGVLSIGQRNQIDRGIYSVLSAGCDSTLPSGTCNSIIIGNNVNRSVGPYNPSPYLIMSVEEFNSRYENGVAEDDPIWTYGNSSAFDMLVIGTGELKAKNGDSSFVNEVRGVALYIRFNKETEIWSAIETVGDPTRSSTMGYNGDLYGNLINHPGHLKNMLMVGDYQNAGWGSENSIFIGDYTGSRRLTAKNSFLNFMGDDGPFVMGDHTAPSSTFDNVWWIGHASRDADAPAVNSDYGYTKDVGDITYHDSIVMTQQSASLSYLTNDAVDTVTQQRLNRKLREVPFKDRFIFTSANRYTFNHSYWYGASIDIRQDNLVVNTNTKSWVYTPNDILNTTKTPMIYTGGIALGGYGTYDNNFMLMKIGYSSSTDSIYSKIYPPVTITNGINTSNSLNRFTTNINRIIRNANVNGPWISTENNTTYIYNNREVKLGTIPPNTTNIRFAVPSRYHYTEGTTQFRIKLQSGNSVYVDCTTTRNNVYTATLTTSLSESATVYMCGTHYDTNGETAYDYFAPKWQYDDVYVETLQLPDQTRMSYTFTDLDNKYIDTDINSDRLRFDVYLDNSGTQGTKIDSVRPATITENDGTLTISASIPKTIRDRYVNNKVRYNVHYAYYLNSTESTENKTEHHLMVDSPYAGMMLTVQDKQELDGTLHVGLGTVLSSRKSPEVWVSGTTSYINRAFSINLYVNSDRSSYYSNTIQVEHPSVDSYYGELNTPNYIVDVDPQTNICVGMCYMAVEEPIIDSDTNEPRLDSTTGDPMVKTAIKLTEIKIGVPQNVYLNINNWGSMSDELNGTPVYIVPLGGHKPVWFSAYGSGNVNLRASFYYVSHNNKSTPIVSSITNYELSDELIYGFDPVDYNQISYDNIFMDNYGLTLGKRLPYAMSVVERNTVYIGYNTASENKHWELATHVFGTNSGPQVFYATYNFTKFVEILRAYSENRTVIVKYPVDDNGNNNTILLKMTSVLSNTNDYKYTFVGTYIDSTTQTNYVATVSHDQDTGETTWNICKYSHAVQIVN